MAGRLSQEVWHFKEVLRMEHRKIIDGPGKWDIILSLFDNQRITFVCDKDDDLSGNYSTSLSVWITSIKREDIHGESWEFKGMDNAGRSVKGYFSPKTRKGEIDLGTPEEFEPKLEIVTTPMTKECWARVEVFVAGKIMAIIGAKTMRAGNNEPFVEFHRVPIE
ncbi:MAG: hypothetical protein V1719_01580 [Patescibacteria group bacterium]